MLELGSAQWLPVPSMPTYCALKFSSLAWAPDGRLVLVGEFPSTGSVLAPGGRVNPS